MGEPLQPGHGLQRPDGAHRSPAAAGSGGGARSQPRQCPGGPWYRSPAGPGHRRRAGSSGEGGGAGAPQPLCPAAQALLAIEGEFYVAEADALFKQALRLSPVGELAQRIKNQQRKLAGRVMRSNAQGMPPMDAVDYLISAGGLPVACAGGTEAVAGRGGGPEPAGTGDQRPQPGTPCTPPPRCHGCSIASWRWRSARACWNRAGCRLRA